MDAWFGSGRLSDLPSDVGGDAPVSSRTFPRVAASIRDSRVWARDVVAGAGLVEHAATVALLVSELATNAVRYGGGDEYTVEFFNGGLVAVTDAGAVPVLTPPSPRLAHEGGRGLRIVDTLAARWGVEFHSVGKRVWFQIDGTPAVLDAPG